MHLADGFLSAATCAGTGLAAGGAVAFALRRVRRAVGDRLVPLMGVMSACVFSAQMVNFPVPGVPGASGHLVGGALAAVVLGPWAAVLAMTVVLFVQCLLFYDGGLTALGANVLNMAVVGPLAGYAVYSVVRRLSRGPSGIVAGAVAAAWVSVQLSAALCAMELWWSGKFDLSTVLPAMLMVHSIIGIGESLITGMVVAFLVRARPELIYEAPSPRDQRFPWRQVIVAGLSAALVVAFFLSPLASAAPDGLEQVTGGLSGAEVARSLPAPMPDYVMPGLNGIWLATSLAGALGSLIVFVLAWVLASGLKRRLLDQGPLRQEPRT